MKKVKGWKCTDLNLKCRDFQFELGKTYKHKGEIELCSKGFHFHENSLDIFKYYNDRENTLVVEIEASGNVITGDDKSVCSKIKIVRILDKDEIESICNLKTNTGLWNSGDGNSGDGNSGYGNSGDGNSGYGNSGDRNSGDRNSGNWNSGYGNSGDRNSGYGNSGDENSGNWNSGSRNSGDENSGNFNKGNYNSGDCNTTQPKVRMFNKDSDWEYLGDNHCRFRDILNKYTKLIHEWISYVNMSDEEKEQNPNYKTIGGYLKVNDIYTNNIEIAKEDEEFLRSVPNFDEAILYECTGIDLIQDEIDFINNELLKELQGK